MEMRDVHWDILKAALTGTEQKTLGVLDERFNEILELAGAQQRELEQLQTAEPYLFLHEPGGCGYTIGCGAELTAVNQHIDQDDEELPPPTDLDGRIRYILRKHLGDDGYRELDQAVLLRLDRNVMDLYREEQQRENDDAAAETLAAKKRQLAELQAEIERAEKR